MRARFDWLSRVHERYRLQTDRRPAIAENHNRCAVWQTEHWTCDQYVEASNTIQGNTA